MKTDNTPETQTSGIVPPLSASPCWAPFRALASQIIEAVIDGESRPQTIAEMIARTLRPERPSLGAKVDFDCDGVKRNGTVTSYAQCADGHFEVTCDDVFPCEVFVLRSDMVRVLPNAKFRDERSSFSETSG